MHEYKYTGKSQVQLIGFGIVNPNDVIKTKEELNHPLFITVVKDPDKKINKQKRYT